MARLSDLRLQANCSYVGTGHSDNGMGGSTEWRFTITTDDAARVIKYHDGHPIANRDPSHIDIVALKNDETGEIVLDGPFM